MKLTILKPEQLTRQSGVGRKPTVDLTSYYNLLVDIPPGSGGSLTLDEGEDKRTIKRRFTRAAGSFEPARKLRWSAARKDGTLVFRVIETEGTTDGGSTDRSSPE